MMTHEQAVATLTDWLRPFAPVTFNRNGMAAMAYDTYAIVFEVPQESEGADGPMYFIRAAITPPNTFKAKDYAWALRTNLFQLASGGFTLALDERYRLELCYAEPIRCVNEHTFATVVANFIVALEEFARQVKERNTPSTGSFPTMTQFA
ncbi:type III secretion system chaperone [Acanthopleuribacter pedis]|uniref:CesT family type III secretion system chaperone n=1 Tax=Acanthopleuribacter pedis TaxID=442870 RepID=A0A8J7QU92_9BACT|nr:type III secretion system chaperone [Acanthopleuribacter pedis]MBO1323333.1 CesT family type III secretion system chaperone [Acanthopleuribacter pedis]